jgi:DeoR/GlpR family transcriptional regulator of sugar metabolism
MKIEQEHKLMTSLSREQKLSLSDTMKLLGVSESTARRMFARLEENGYAVRTHGGIQCVNQTMMLYSFEQGTKTNIAKKAAIGRKACSLLRDGDVIFCDSGTTIQCFCNEMILYIRDKKINIKVYTNSLANLELLSPHMKVTLIGGEYRTNRKDFFGYIGEQALGGLYFDKTFIGADGCVDAQCFTTTDFETARLDEIAMKNSESTIMLVDSSKFSVFSHVSFAPVKSLYAIVTDHGITKETQSKIEKEGCRIILSD